MRMDLCHDCRAMLPGPLITLLGQSLARSDHDRHERPRATTTSGEAGGLALGRQETRDDVVAFGAIARRSHLKRWARALTLGAIALASAGCSREDRPAESTFYERRIGPVLQGSCATSPTRSGCHVAADDRGNALGNLNISSYETLTLRRDLLVDYGPYGVPGLLLKVVPQFDLRLTYWDDTTVTVRTDIAHGGGSLLDFTSASYTTLERWIENGAAV